MRERDFRPSLCQGERVLLLARSGERALQPLQNSQSRIVPLGKGSCLRRTGHPFTVSGLWAVTED
jgi:hypothetical protein